MIIQKVHSCYSFFLDSIRSLSLIVVEKWLHGEKQKDDKRALGLCRAAFSPNFLSVLVSLGFLTCCCWSEHVRKP